MKKIKIFNARLGFACNSSSTHSFLMLNDGESAQTTEKTDFGWSLFVASNEESKANYLGSSLNAGLAAAGVPVDLRDKFMFDVLRGRSYSEEAYVDHQSELSIPTDFEGRPNAEFMKEVCDFIMRNDVAVLGGNDNDSVVHPTMVKGKEALKDFPKEDRFGIWVARKDSNGGYWTLFNKDDGTKMRFSFDDGGTRPIKASFPELADVKITDFCPYGCEFCYQGSTVSGTHASMERIVEIADRLAKAEVFEVALGGGEPTSHPEFLNVMKAFSERGIRTNFTTRNYALARRADAGEIFDLAGAIAFSVGSERDLDRLAAALLDSPKIDSFFGSFSGKPSIAVQIPMGTTSMEEFEKILKRGFALGIQVTLLGYKETGRGVEYAPFDYRGWLEVTVKAVAEARKAGYPKISIDTALAAEFEKEILAAGAKAETFEIEEGAFSMYVDAVRGIMAPSSYAGSECEEPFDEDWERRFAEMRPRRTMRGAKRNRMV